MILIATLLIIVTTLSAGDTDLEALLPDRWAASHPEHVLTYRLDQSRRKAARQQAIRTPSPSPRLPLPRGIDPPDHVRRRHLERVADTELGVHGGRLEAALKLADIVAL
jgi:hypothetical protein